MNLKNILLAAIAFVALVSTADAQTKENSFQIEKIGNGKQNILFIPGFASSGEVWKETIDALGNDYTYYVLTMAGFASVPAQTDPSFKGWRDDIIEYIESEKILNPIIIGHSMGGVMAMDIAAAEPTLISKIVVVDALPCLAALSDPNYKSKPNIDCSAIVNQMNSITDEQFKAMQKQVMTGMVQDKSKQQIILDWTMKSDRSTFGKMFCDFSNTDLREEIKSIQCPTLILLESSFKQIKPAIEQQYVNLRSADFRYAENSLHFIMYDAKDWYLQQVQNFLK